MAASSGKRRLRGTIRRRGNSLQVIVYAGVDPSTGERMYLRESTTDPAEAERIRAKFLSQVDDGRNAKTRATLAAALEAWLRTHEAEETTLDGYRGYIGRTIEPALGGVLIGKVTVQLLEELYADLRRAGSDAATGSRPSTTGRPCSTSATSSATAASPVVPAGRHTTASRPVARSSSARRTCARRWRRGRRSVAATVRWPDGPVGR